MNKLVLLIIVILIFLIITENPKKCYEKFIQKEYIRFTGDLGKFGLSHHKSNLKYLILKSKQLNKILIMPKFVLTKKHNNNNEITCNLSKYFDIKNIKLNGEKIEIVYENELNEENIYEYKLPISSKYRTIHNNKEFKLNGNLEINYSREIIYLGKKISKDLGNYCCVHVRRTDRNNSKIDKFTRPENILKKLKYVNSPKNVYIMTDEKEEGFFDEIKNYYNLKLCRNIKELKNIKDNYYIFCIEKIIMNNASKKISNFKTKGETYDTYLINKNGWQ
tara:strand:- start:2364 stop:3194 length:831 start_codon:yes stop_codon:yes gene_type:complete